MNRLKIIALAGLAALDVAAAGFAWRAVAGADASDDVPARSAPMIVPAAQPEALASTGGEDAETLARPLFTKSRRPSQSRGASSAGVADAPPPAGMKLHAVIGFSHSARAFVTSDAVADGKWLSVGETFENWTVDSIADQNIAVRKDAEILRLGLDYDGSGASSGPAPEPRPAPPKDEPHAEPAAAKVVAPDAFAAIRDAKRGGH